MISINIFAAPHLGHLYTALIADASYRWNLFECGGTCLFVSGTDEHGTKVPSFYFIKACFHLSFRLIID